MKKKIMAFATCLVICCSFMLNGFVSNAQIGTGEDGLDFYVPYSKPDGDNVGYVSLVLRKDGVNYLSTMYWITTPYCVYDNAIVNDFGSFGLVNFDNNNVFVELNNSSKNMMMLASFGVYREETNFNSVLRTTIVSAEDWITCGISYGDYGYEVVGFEIGGNAVHGGASNYEAPRIHWGGDDSVHLLEQVCSLLGQGLVPLKLYLPKLSSIDMNLSEIKQLLDEMYGSITDDEQQKVDQFEEDSGSQSEELGSLNQQTQVDKPDVDSVSQQVDSVLEMETDANYGVLLSTFTSNGRVLTMMLLCVSVALISFVLFGKR